VPSPRIWQWPNILALDAALAAILWQRFFAPAAGNAVAWSEAAVLGLSVWLTYTADRLFDARRRPAERLMSIRHRFADRNASTLWLVWAGALGADIGIACLFLEPWQLQRGSLLLLACLAYTFLHQAVFTRFFPKEIVVALIFASGIWVFLENPSVWLPWLAFALLCLLNCLVIASKEREVDRSLEVRSVGSVGGPLPIFGVALLGLFTALALPEPARSAILWAIGTTVALFTVARRIGVERFRVLADGVLVLVPLAYLLLRS